MQCMKCGREVPAGQVFCDECLADMSRYPVKPGTAVHLPPRRQEPILKRTASRRKQLTPEEQVKVLKRRLWIVSVTLALVLSLVAGCLYFAVDYILENEGKPLPGQNYTTAETKGEQERPQSN